MRSTIRFHRRAFWSVALLALLLSSCGKVFEEDELPNTFEIPAGSEVFVRPVETFKPTMMELGEQFAGVLAKPLFYTREILEPDGDTFERKTLVAPQGAPVHGMVVAEEPASDQPARVGVKLTSITFHGGKSFPVETAPVYQFKVVQGDPGDAPPIRKVDVIPFTLTSPTDVALVIDFRREQARSNQESGC